MRTPVTDPVEWLTEKLDETQRIAEDAAHDRSGKWPFGCTHVGLDSERLPPSHDLCAKIDNDEIVIYDEGGHSVEQARHICTWDPATVLRLVAATRALLELHHVDGLGSCPSCAELDPEQKQPGWIVLNPCDTVIELAKGWGWVDE